MDFNQIIKLALIGINGIGILLVWWVLSSGSDIKLKRWFLLMTVSMLSWSNFSYLGSVSASELSAVIFYKINWASVSLFMPSFYYFYVVTYLKKDGYSKFIGRVLSLLFLILFVVSLFTDLVINDVVKQSWGNEIVFGTLGDIFNILSAFVAFVIIYYSLRGYKLFSDENKKKTQYFLTGIVIFIIANLIFNVASQLLFNSVQYQFLGDFSSIFLLGFTAYATIQYKLFDSKVIITEAATALLMIILLSRIVTDETYTDMIIDVGIFFVALFFGYILVRSVRNEIKQREKLQELTDKLQALDKQKDEFINMAAHELRAPMTAIKGYISMIMDGDAGEISDKARGYLTDVTSVNDRLVRLVNNMLNVSRIEEGRLVYKTEVLPLSEIAKNVYTSFKFEAERKGLTMDVVIEKGIKDLVEVDPDKINEIIGNFVSNAVKYTETGSIEIKISQPAIGKVKLSVIDSGPGISKEEQNKLFQKFYRVQSTAGKTIGTGLGLYISKLLVEKFNGQLGLNSAVGKGSEFWFVLPVADGQESQSTVVES